MKKICFFILTLCLCSQNMTGTIVGSGTITGSNLGWSLDDVGLLSITGVGDMPNWTAGNQPWGANPDRRLDIKRVSIDFGVTTIGASAFNGCNDLISVDIPASVTSIGASAFSSCDDLTGVIIPNSVGTIGNYAFSDCRNLTSVTIPKGTIGEAAFSGCAKLASVTIGEGVTYIGHDAFFGCAQLKALTFNAGSVTIDANGAGWSNLTTVTIGEGVTSVPTNAFTAGLTPPLATINFNAKNYTGSAFLGSSFSSSLKTVYIGPNVTRIPFEAFKDLTQVKSVNIPNSVTTIGSSAFEDAGLTSVTIGEGVQTIESYAFKSCPLTSVTFNAVNCATYGVFSDFTTLTEVNIGTKVTRIPERTFNNTGVKNVSIPASVTTIEDYAFADCSSLATLTLNEGLQSIEQSAFASCAALKTLTIPNSVTSIGQLAFNACSGLETLTIGNGVTTINNAFSGLTGLKTLTIGEGVTSITAGLFTVATGLTQLTFNAINCAGIGSPGPGWTKLTTVDIGTNVTAIPAYAFSGCTELTDIILPAGVKTVGVEAFSGCNKLKAIESQSQTPPTAAASSFTGVNTTTCVLTVPGGSKAAYQAATGWKDFKLAAIAVSGVMLNHELILEKGDTFRLHAVISPIDADNQTVTWKATGNATVSDGLVTAGTTAGEAKITATAANGKNDTCHVRVLGEVSTEDKDTIIYNKTYKDTIIYEDTTYRDTTIYTYHNKDTIIYEDTTYRDTTIYRYTIHYTDSTVYTDTIYKDSIVYTDTIYTDTTIYKTDTVYNVTERDTTIYKDTVIYVADTVYKVTEKDTTVYNVTEVDSVEYNIITEDSIEYNIITQDSVEYNIVTQDSVEYNIITRDSVDYTLVPDTVYIPVVTDITGVQHFVTANARVSGYGEGILIQGLEPKAEFYIYTVTGERLYTNIANATGEYWLSYLDDGLYILFFRDSEGKGQYSKFSHRKQ